MSLNSIKLCFVDLKYFLWVFKNWPLLRRYRNSIISFLGYWILYLILRPIFGKTIARKILSKENFILPIPTNDLKIYWIKLRDRVDYDTFRGVCIEDAYNSRLIKPGMTVIDAGAHIGTFTLLASKIVGEKGKVIFVEAEKQNFQQIIENLQLNNIKNCIGFNLALSNYKGEDFFYLQSNSCAHSFSPKNAIGKIKVKVTTLDNLTENLKGKMGFLKLDVKDVEIQVLEKAKKTISKNPEMIIVIDTHSPQKVMECLKTMGRSPGFSQGYIWA